MRYKANRSLKLHKKEEHGILVANYQVGIWRNGPVPPDPKGERKKAVTKRKTKTITVPKDIYNANLRATFATKSLRVSLWKFLCQVTDFISLSPG